MHLWEISQHMKEYVISQGTSQLLVHRYGLHLSESAQQRIDTIENRLCDTIPFFLPQEVLFKKISAQEIETGMLQILGKETRPKINVDDVYFQQFGCDHYSLTRRTYQDDMSRNEIGARSGYPSLEDQCKKLARQEEVVLIDVGVFSGSTLLNQATTYLPAQGIHVGHVYVSIASTNAIEKFQSAGVGITAAYTFDFYDWIEARDFVGLDGRKPLVDFDIPKGNLIIPYKYNLSQWASINDSEGICAQLCESAYNQIIDVVQSEGIRVRNRPIRTNAHSVTHLLEFEQEVANEARASIL